MTMASAKAKLTRKDSKLLV